MRKDAEHCIIVSDELGLRESLSLSLRMKNYNVTSTSDGMQALFLLEEKQLQGVEMSFAVIGSRVKVISPIELIMFMRAKYPDQEQFPIYIYNPHGKESSEDSISSTELRKAGASVIFEKMDLSMILNRITHSTKSTKKRIFEA